MKSIHTLFAVILIGTLCLLGYQYPFVLDLTYNKNNTLNKANRELLSKLDKPLIIELITPDQNMLHQVQAIVSLFQKGSPHIQFKVRNKGLSPTEKAELRVYSNHNLLISYDNDIRAIDLKLSGWSEQSFANLINQILRQQEQWVVFLSGHGEPDAEGQDARDFGQLTAELKSKGLKIATLNLGAHGVIPDNTNLLVLADNQAPLLPQEMKQVVEYVKQGGHFLWLVNPDSLPRFEALEKILGIHWRGGMIEDPKSHALGTPHPSINIIHHYPPHIITQKVDILSIFPWSTPIEYTLLQDQGFDLKPLLVTDASTFIKKANKKEEGPFTLGIALTKTKQRVIAIGNSHFLSNATIRNYGNLLLANNIFNWLNTADQLISVPTRPAIDLNFSQTPLVKALIHYLFPYGLPLLYLGWGWQIQRRRQQNYCRSNNLIIH